MMPFWDGNFMDSMLLKLLVLISKKHSDLQFKKFSILRNKLESDGPLSGLYGGCDINSQLNYNNFVRVANM